MADVWGSGSWDGDTGSEFDPELGSDSPDDKDFVEIERLARAGGQSADGVLGRPAPPVAPPRSVSYNRPRWGLNARGGRKSNDAKLAEQSTPRADANGNGNGVRITPAATSRLSEQVVSGNRGVLPTGLPRPVPRPVNPEPIIAVDRLGTRNTAHEVFPTGFSSAHIRCAVKDLKFTVSGDLEMRLIIPFEFRSEGTKFADAYGVELEIDAKRVEYGND